MMVPRNLGGRLNKISLYTICFCREFGRCRNSEKETDSHHHELVETLKLFKWIQFGRVEDMTKCKVIGEISIIINYGPRVSQIRGTSEL